MSELDNTTAPAAAGSELTSIAAVDTFDVPVTNANGDPFYGPDGKQATITIYGPGSKTHSKATSARSQRMIDRMAKKGRVKLSAEQQLAEGAEFLAAITVSFNGLLYKGAADRAAILAAYKDPSIGFIADQVQAAAGDWTNFTKGGVTS